MFPLPSKLLHKQAFFVEKKHFYLKKKKINILFDYSCNSEFILIMWYF